MGSPGAVLLSPWPEVHPGHRPRTPPVDGPRQRHQCQGDSLVPRSPGLPLRRASPRRGRERQRRRSSLGSGQLFAGLSGVTPHPPPINPLLSHVSNRTRTTLRGGSVTSVPVSHQRPGNGGRTPALPHYRLIGPSCSSSAGSVISPADLATVEFNLQKGCS